MKRVQLFTFLLLCIGLLLFSCEKEQKNTSKQTDPNATTVKPEPVNVPSFNADTAYALVEKQLEFGPRSPGTAAHRACGDWMVSKLKSFGASVIEQTGNVQAWDLQGNRFNLPLRNIIASYSPEKGRRILFSAHWDTRPFADQGEERQAEPIPGANDGGSGVAVLLEMARHFATQNPNVGVDLIFWDVEDHGNPDIRDSYCLGSQYWGKTPHKAGYAAMYGINLDMVGAKGASFLREGYSMQFAAPIVSKVWNRAIGLGYGKEFLMRNVDAITDDHFYMNIGSKIPTIDIIDMRPSTGQTFFGQWHTHQDDIHIIDRQTLKAVGQTMLHVAYEER